MAYSTGKPYIVSGKDAEVFLAAKPDMRILEMHSQRASLGGGIKIVAPKEKPDENRRDK